MTPQRQVIRTRQLARVHETVMRTRHDRRIHLQSGVRHDGGRAGNSGAMSMRVIASTMMSTQRRSRVVMRDRCVSASGGVIGLRSQVASVSSESTKTPRHMCVCEQGSAQRLAAAASPRAHCARASPAHSHQPTPIMTSHVDGEEARRAHRHTSARAPLPL
jgi:hypothetical protein